MNKTRRLIGIITIFAAAFAGCSSGALEDAAPTPETLTVTPSVASESENTPEASPEPEPVITDPAEAKAAALEAGRPEAAWDLHCVAWDVNNPEAGGTGLAHELANTWLDAYDAACPDAIVHPGYYAQSFENGGPGEVIVTLEDAALEDYYVEPNGDLGLKLFGRDLVHEAIEANTAVEAVTVTVEDTDRAFTVTPEGYIEHLEGFDLPAPTPAPAIEAGSWAEKQLEAYLTYQGANSLAGFDIGSPERNITAVTSPADGVVRFEVADRDYEADGWQLEGLAVNYMSYVGCAADDVDAVIVETARGTESVTRNRCG